jgi:ABC-2 type transport system permease protein
MLLHILRFELKFWFRGLMVWIFLLIIAAMVGGALSSDNIRIGTALENTFKNAPHVILMYYSIMAVLTMLMTTAFVNSAAARDFAYNTNQILFSTPLRKFDFLVGRYAGAVLVSVVPMLGISVAALVVKYMPWVDAEKWGPVNWQAHLMAILIFAIPNTIFISAVTFAIATLTRSTTASFLGMLFLLVGLAISDTLLSDLANERIAVLLDPFGANAFSQITKYWTVADKNTQVVGLSGDLLWNRLIWIGVGLAVFAFAYSRFSFAEKMPKPKKEPRVLEADHEVAPQMSQLRWSGSPPSRMAQFLGALKTEFWGLVKTTSFVVIVAAAMLNMIPSLIFSAAEGYGNSTYPVTYQVLQVIFGTLYAFLMAIITYFAGALVWKERDAHMDEIHDAMPFPDWISYASKLLALLGAVALILLAAMLSGMAVQAWEGYTRYQIGLYVSELFLIDGSQLFLFSLLAFLFHVLSPNKYIAYFAFIAFLIANAFVWQGLNVGSRMLMFASRPTVIYSDLYGRAPFWESWTWFTLYWLLFGGILAVASILLWRRGKEATWAERFRVARQRLHSSLLPMGVALSFGFLACAVWIFYNTKIVNRVEGPKDALQRQADYEKAYKKHENDPLPRVTAIRYNIDIFPERRAIVLKGEQTLVNKTAGPIAEMRLAFNQSYEHEVAIDGAKQTAMDKRLQFATYRFEPALQPGESRTMRFTTKREPKGFENSVSAMQLVQNGTFFNNSIAPQIGYQPGAELADPNDRKKYGLPAQDLMPALERDCKAKCGDTYLSSSSDWVSLETTISTSADQMAIAPGSLVKEWKENGRNFYQYKFDQNSLNFYSFISAAYKVAREEWNGVKVEVYYHPEHEWNVPKMLRSIKKSLEYATKNYGPYAHKQARIIEFPRVARFAQAFPGTMPYSEGIGFVANLKNPDDIDMVYYVVAHEMGHQWWAHQVVGANMQGATLLSETLAQYTALMVMEHEYGRDMMRKFLQYEMDRYLRARGGEMLKERPMLQVEASQGYIHYNKGSIVMYNLKEMIGEEAINRALRKLIAKFAYGGPPFPTSYDLVDALREETPAEMQYLIKDLFEEITLFSNRALSASAAKRPDGKFDVTLEVESRKFKADAKGNETETRLDDWIEIGAFAKPQKGKKYGATLYRERIRLAENRKKFQFVTGEYPEQVGIDPFRLLVDRITDDNMKKLAAQ